MTDLINNPSHYKTESGLEAIDVLEAFFENDPLGWQVGKYLLRAGKKEGSPTVQDLKKAEFYLKRKISRIEAAEKAEELKKFNETISEAIEKMSRDYYSSLYTVPQAKWIFGIDTAADHTPVEPIDAEVVPEPREPQVGDKIKAIKADTHTLADGEIGEIAGINGIYFKVRKESGHTSWLIRKEFTLVEPKDDLADWEKELLKAAEPRLKVGDKVKVLDNPAHGEEKDGCVSPDAAGQIGTITSVYEDGDFDVHMPYVNLYQTIGGYSLARVFQNIADVPEGVLVKDIDGDTWKTEDGELLIAYTNDYPGTEDFEEGSDADAYAPFVEIIKEGN